MHNYSSILQTCFDKIFEQDFVEVIPNIPNIKKEKYVQCWHIKTEVDIQGMSNNIDLYVGIPNSFPYVIPDFYYFDSQYDYFPHIDYQNRKLCIFEENLVLNVEYPELIILSCLKQAKRVISNGINNQNIMDFTQEVESYWTLSYNNESTVDTRYIIYGTQPEKIEVLNILQHYNGNKLIVNDNDLQFVRKHFHSVVVGKILFSPRFTISRRPPYVITWQGLKDCVDQVDLDEIERFIRTTGCLNILFPLANNSLFGGVYFERINTRINGFRDTYFTPVKALNKIYKTKKIPRIMAKVYNKNRIEGRTSGGISTPYKFSIVGCGSIGSNLCSFLRSYNDASFVLVDNDLFTIDNIGRHLLGFDSINQFKTVAIKNVLQSTRPEMDVQAISRSSYDCSVSSFVESSAIFFCTGNLMAELELLGRFTKHNVLTPKFIVWFEPYAIAGHMIYLNKLDNDRTLQSLFTNELYKHNLIRPEEYKNPDAFTKRDAGCNGSYTLYSGNDVMLFLSAIFPLICDLINSDSPSTCYRWIGNTQIAIEKRIGIFQTEMQKYQIETFPIQ